MATDPALDDRSHLHKDINRTLNDNLMSGELVRVIIYGNGVSAMIGTDRRVFVFKKGWMAGATFGKKIASWDYANITGIQIVTGPTSGVVAIEAAGVQAVNMNYWAGGPNSADNSPNAIKFSGKDHLERARLGTAELRRLIAEHQAVKHAPPQPAQTIIEQLRQLGELHSSGILTKEEFEAKKSDLLARL
jgi:hypothetical protein